MLNRGPLVRSNCDILLKNVTNVRGEVDPEKNYSSQNSQITGQMNFVVPQYLVQESMLPSVSHSVLFNELWGYIELL